MNNLNIGKILLIAFLSLISSHVFSTKESESIDDISIDSDQEAKKEYVAMMYDLLRRNQDSAFQLIKDFESKIKPEEKEVLIRYRNVAATYYWNIGRLDTAALLYVQNIDTADKYQIWDRKINSMSNLGAILNVMGQVDSAYHYLLEALPLAMDNQDTSMLSKIRFDLGNYYKNKGYYHLALDELLQAKDYYERHKESIIIVYTYNSLGTLYTALEEPDKAKFYLQTAIKMDSARDDVFLLHDLYNNLGVTLWKLNHKLDSARFYLKKAYDISLQYNSPAHQLVYLLNLGGLESEAGNLQASFEYLSSAEKLEPLVDNPYKLSALYINLGSYYSKKKTYTLSHKYYHKGIQKAKSIPAFDNLINAYRGLAYIDSLQANYLEVLKYYKMIDALNDSLQNTEMKNRIAELEIIHKTEQKEQQNHLLKEQNYLQSQLIQFQRNINVLIGFALFLFFIFLVLLLSNRKKLQEAKKLTDIKNAEIIEKNQLIEIKNSNLQLQKNELEELNQTKDKFFTIIAHDLKNPFNSLLGLLDILESDFDDIEDTRKIEIIKKLANSGRNTYNMLLNLLDWARSQRGSIKANIEVLNLYDIVNSAKVFLAHRISDKEHQVNINMDDSIQVMADKNLLQTIIINVLNNAVKFTERGGSINIETEEIDTKIRVSIRDNGIGMPNEKLQSLFEISSKSSSRGTDNEIGTGLGLILAKEFAGLMNANIYAESEVGEGSVFYVEVPKRD